jgi:hypothetical protein
VVRRRGFSRLQELFDSEQRLAGGVHHDPAAWVAAYRQVREAVRLIGPDGHEAPDFLLHIDGNRARWRCWNHATANRLKQQLVSTAPAPNPSRAARRLATAILGLLTPIALPAAALAHPLHHRQSSNWAGYAAAAARPFQSVYGRWVQPAAKCDQPSATYAAFWVGLGGFKPSSQKLEQIGTEADCTARGTGRMFAWYELMPAAPVTLRLPVYAGDRLAARVTLTAERVRLRIRNLTTHRSVTKTVRVPAPDTSSADWIAEAPSACVTAGQCRPLPLTDFGTVQFTGASATTTGGHARSISDPGFTATELTLNAAGPPLDPQPVGFSRASSAQATPSRLSQHGGAFALNFKPAAHPGPPPPPPVAAPDQLRHHRFSPGDPGPRPVR